MAKVLILAGDAAEDLETMYIKYRLSEAGHEPHVSAPTTRPIKLVVHDFEPDFDTYVEKPGRSCPVDVAFADVDPAEYAGDRDPRREGARVHPRRPGRQADRGALLRRGEARGHALSRAAGAGRARSAAGQALVGLPAARSGHRARRAPSTWTAPPSWTATWSPAAGWGDLADWSRAFLECLDRAAVPA